MSSQPAPFERCHWRVKFKLLPSQVPTSPVSVSPSTALPEIVGGEVLTGGSACADAAPRPEAQVARSIAITKRLRADKLLALLPVGLMAALISDAACVLRKPYLRLKDTAKRRPDCDAPAEPR
jgi:hypothetical protein